MVTKPSIQWFPAHRGNVEPRLPGVVYEAWVIHTTDGSRTVADLGRWFGGENLRRGLQGSTHFGADLVGDLGQYVDLSEMAIAHGNLNPMAKLAHDNGDLSANYWAAGCEHLDGGEPGTVTPVQLRASAGLCAWYFATEVLPHAARTGAAVDRDHIIGHYQLASNKPRCPSWPEARFTEYIGVVRDVLATPDVRDWRAEYEAELRGQLAAADDDAVRIAVRVERLKRALAELVG